MKLLLSISPSVTPPDLGVITLLSHTGAITRGLSAAVFIRKSIRLSLAGGAAVEAMPLLLALLLCGDSTS